MQLPEDFVRLMHEQYDTDTADALCHALLETEPEVSIRLNAIGNRIYPVKPHNILCMEWQNQYD